MYSIKKKKEHLDSKQCEKIGVISHWVSGYYYPVYEDEQGGVAEYKVCSKTALPSPPANKTTNLEVNNNIIPKAAFHKKGAISGATATAPGNSQLSWYCPCSAYCVPLNTHTQTHTHALSHASTRTHSASPV